jgi:hypothetical protein
LTRFYGATAVRRVMGYDEVGLAIRPFTDKQISAGAANAPRVMRCAIDR